MLLDTDYYKPEEHYHGLQRAYHKTLDKTAQHNKCYSSKRINIIIQRVELAATIIQYTGLGHMRLTY